MRQMGASDIVQNDRKRRTYSLPTFPTALRTHINIARMSSPDKLKTRVSRASHYFSFNSQSVNKRRSQHNKSDSSITKALPKSSHRKQGKHKATRPALKIDILCDSR